MKAVLRAVIDVGTNSVKLLVAQLADGEVRPVWEGSHQTRLGRGFYQTRLLQPGPIRDTVEAVVRFVAKAREQQAESIRIIATSAARDAVNADELTAALAKACGFKVEILSGEEEAELGFRGVSGDPRLAGTPLLLLDVGGGSTEFILGYGGQPHFCESFPLGTVRLMEQLPHQDPPQPADLATSRQWLKDFLTQTVAPRLTPAMRRERELDPAHGQVLLVGAGGTASILGCMEARLEVFDRARLEATRLSREALRGHVERLWSLPLQERKQVVGLPKNRVDVILTGVAIYEAVMTEFGFSELRISTRGLRFAAVLG